MAAKNSAKREFDWRAYSRPVRLLDESMEAAFVSGLLQPILAFADTNPGVSFHIRARQATLYYRGVSLLRVRAHDTGLLGEVDANLRLPHDRRASAECLESCPLLDHDDVVHLIGVVDALRRCLDGWTDAGEPPAPRQHLLAFAAANAGTRPELDEILVVDVEYPYGRRKYDFVAVRRATSVGGAAAFTTPQLVLGDLRFPLRALSGSSRLSDFASDASELAHALSGSHLTKVRDEVAALLRQKQRLALLPPEIPFERMAVGDPELLVAFTDAEAGEPRFDRPIAELHDKLIARRFSIDHLRFAAVGRSRRGPGAHEGTDLAVGRDDVLDYRAFKAMRHRMRV